MNKQIETFENQMRVIGLATKLSGTGMIGDY